MKVMEGGSMMCGLDSDGGPQVAAGSTTTAPEAAYASGPGDQIFAICQQKNERVCSSSEQRLNHWARQVAASSANNDGMPSLRFPEGRTRRLFPMGTISRVWLQRANHDPF